jgi:hypothetical protein
MEPVKVFTFPMIEKKLLYIRLNSLRKLDEKMGWPDGLEKRALGYRKKSATSPRPTGGNRKQSLNAALG